MTIDWNPEFHKSHTIHVSGDLDAPEVAEPLKRMEVAFRDLLNAINPAKVKAEWISRGRPFREGEGGESKKIPPPLRGQALEEVLTHQAVPWPPLSEPTEVRGPLYVDMVEDGVTDNIPIIQAIIDTLWVAATAAPPAAEPFEPVTKEGDGGFDRAITDAERVSIRQSLMDTWGISAAAAIETEPFEQATRPYAMSCEACRLTPPRGFLNAAATRFFCGSCYRGGAR